jgi:hypothetical protein
MTQPYTDAEVNAAIAATVDELRSKADGYVDHIKSLQAVVSPQKMMELQARIQQLKTYSRCDAETITQLQGRVGELEAENARLVESLHKLIGTKSTLITSKLPQ